MEFDKMTLDELAQELSPSEVSLLQYLKSQSHLTDLRKKIEEDALTQEEIVSQYSQNQYVEQEVEVLNGLTITLRTITPQAMDESIAFSNKHKGDSVENGPRILARRRLSHALIEINGNTVGPLPLDGSYFQLMMADAKGFKKKMQDRADSIYELLSVHGLSDKMCEVFGVWESVIYNRLNGIEDLQDALKNSTRGSANAQ